MKTQHPSKPDAFSSVAMTIAAEKRLQNIAEKLANRELFPEKVRQAKKALNGLTILPA